MTTGNSSALVKQADLLVTLSRTSIRKNSIFLPLLDVVKRVISEAIKDGEDGDEDSDEVDKDEAAKEWTGGEEVEEESENDKINDYHRRPEYKVDGYKMGVKEFEILTARNFHVLSGDLGFGMNFSIPNCSFGPAHPHRTRGLHAPLIFSSWKGNATQQTLLCGAIRSLLKEVLVSPYFSKLLTNFDRLCV
jgi:hypothetical protein